MAPQEFTIGLDVGGTNIRAARITRSGEILEKVSVAGSRDPAAALAIIHQLVEKLDGAHAQAIGVGIPGRVNGWTGEILSGGYLNLAGTDLKAELSTAFGKPVTVANDCSMALLAEARIGAARGHRNATMLTIGTGIGGAVMESGRIVHGRQTAGQLGHIIVRDGGHPCACGQRGCVETESSGTALRRHLDEAGFGAEVRFENLLLQAQAGDPHACGVMRSWAGPLRAAIQTLAAVIDPEIVILGGGMGQAAVTALGFLPQVKSWYEVKVRHAELGDDAGVIGSGLAAFELLGMGRPSGKRLIMVNGVPGSGKSALAHALSQKSNWPILALDTIKNPFLELIENVDRDFNRLLGRASYKAIFSTIKGAPAGSTFIVDAWFGFQSIETLSAHMEMAGITDVSELWCHAPPEIIGERYRSRANSRLPGHPGLSYVSELIQLAARAKPTGLAPVMEIDTTRPWNLDEIMAWLSP